MGGQLIDLSLYGAFREPVPGGTTTGGAVSSPQPYTFNPGPLQPALAATAPGEPRSLIVADDPEQIPSAGMLYADTLAGHVRVFAYGVNASGQRLTLGVGVVGSLGQVTVAIERLGAAAGQSNGPYVYSSLAAQRWLATNYAAAAGGQAPIITAVTIGGGAFAEVASVDLPPIASGQPGAPGYVGNVIVDLLLSGSAQVVVYARQTSVTKPTSYPTNLLPAKHSPIFRGTFPQATFAVAAQAPMDSYLALPPVGASPFPGRSAVDGQPAANPGFGVEWDVALQVEQPPKSILPRAPYAQVALGPLTGYGVETAVFWQIGNLQTIEDVYGPAPAARDIHTGLAVGLGTVPWGQAASLVWIGTGGIGYPVGIFTLNPQTPRLQIAEVVGAAAMPALAALTGHLLRPRRYAEV